MVVTRNDGERRQTVLKRAGGRIVAETRRNAAWFVSVVEGNGYGLEYESYAERTRECRVFAKKIENRPKIAN